MEWLKRSANTSDGNYGQKDVYKPDMYETCLTKYAAYAAKMYQVGTVKQKSQRKDMIGQRKQGDKAI